MSTRRQFVTRMMVGGGAAAAMFKNDALAIVADAVNHIGPEQWCGLVNVYIDGVDMGKLADYLLDKHRIYLVPIGHEECKGIRVTPNVYTLPSEIDCFAEAMEKVARGEVKEVMEHANPRSGVQ